MAQQLQDELSCTIFVGNIAVFTTETDLHNHFVSCGEITEVRLARSEDMSKHLSYGFIRYANVQSALLAIQTMGGTILCGRPLKVHKAQSRTDRSMAKSAEKPQAVAFNSASVHVTFISHQVKKIINEETLRFLFNRFGDIHDVIITKHNVDEQGSKQSGYGFIHFPLTNEGIQSALLMTEQVADMMIDEVNYKCKLSHDLEQRLYGHQTPGHSSTPTQTPIPQHAHPRHTSPFPSVGYSSTSPTAFHSMGSSRSSPRAGSPSFYDSYLPVPPAVQQHPYLHQSLLNRTNSGWGAYGGGARLGLAPTPAPIAIPPLPSMDYYDSHGHHPAHPYVNPSFSSSGSVLPSPSSEARGDASGFGTMGSSSGASGSYSGRHLYPPPMSPYSAATPRTRRIDTGGRSSPSLALRGSYDGGLADGLKRLGLYEGNQQQQQQQHTPRFHSNSNHGGFMMGSGSSYGSSAGAGAGAGGLGDMLMNASFTANTTSSASVSSTNNSVVSVSSYTGSVGGHLPALDTGSRVSSPFSFDQDALLMPPTQPSLLLPNTPKNLAAIPSTYSMGDDTQVGIGMLDDMYQYTPSASMYGFNSNNTSMYAHNHAQAQHRPQIYPPAAVPGHLHGLPSPHSNVSMLSEYTQTGSFYRTPGAAYGGHASLYSFVDNKDSRDDLSSLLDLPLVDGTPPSAGRDTADVTTASFPAADKSPMGKPKHSS